MPHVQPEPTEAVITHPVDDKPVYHYSRPQTDTKTVVIAVGASVVLFVIGLILGYLLGHQSVDNDQRGSTGSSSDMMNNTYRNRVQTQSTTN
jgi:hypothetical protein